MFAGDMSGTKAQETGKLYGQTTRKQKAIILGKTEFKGKSTK